MEEEGSRRAEDLVRIIDDPGEYMPAMRAARVVLGLSAAAVAVVFFLRPVQLGLLYLEMKEGDLLYVISVCCLILLLTLVMCAFTELLPRRIAVLHADGIAMANTGFCQFLIGIMKPMTVISSGIVFVFLKIFRSIV